MSNGASRDTSSTPGQGSLGELALIFLRLGATSFGGPAAHIALMKAEFVDRRKWLTELEFLDLVSAANLIPGPNSTEVAIHIGYRRAGWLGLLIAGACFILPAAVCVAAIAWAYVKFGRLPPIQGILYAVKPIIIVIVAQALWTLGRAALKTRLLTAVAMVATVLSLAGVGELLLLFGAGSALGVAGYVRADREGRTLPLRAIALGIAALIGFPLLIMLAQPPAMAPPGASPLFLVFLKIGSVLYGSGYVLLAFLRSDFVTRLHWLTSAQLIDATAVGQVTPGPVFTTATFIGYVLAGPWGAVAATIGIFLPAFLYVALTAPLIGRVKQSPAARGFLDGVNAASLALMAVVTWQLARAALIDPLTIALAVLAALLLFRFKVNSAWLVLGGAALGMGLGLAGWRGR
jgi:chromate transporter